MKKILIANRGEIAVRIIRTCREMGLATVAVYSDSDRTALHVRLADEAYAIGPDQATESYLRIDKLVDVARRSGAQAVHPGYGFLAENAGFAAACGQARLIFIGPSPQAMADMGSKTRAREIALRAGVPVVPGMQSPMAGDIADGDLQAAGDAIGFPLLVKAVAGGGGKGMRVVRDPQELAGAVRLARSEARSAFGDDAIYFERLLERPRHVEVQLLGDRHGTVVPFVERECSVQRRHQKLIEETPSPAVSDALRARLTAAAAAIGRAAAYTSAGTVEFLLDGDGRFYFLEMNTRLQVEHPITEAVTGVDFVRAQIEIAQGAKLADLQLGAAYRGTADVEPVFRPAHGHAIEVRIYAEDPESGFLPSPGLITHLRPAAGPGIREDSGATAGWTVPTAYDALISKVIAWAPDRAGAMARVVRALAEYDLRGIRSTVGFCRELIQSEAFRNGALDTTFVDRFLQQQGRPATSDEGAGIDELAAIAAALCARRDAENTVRTDPDSPSLWAETGRLENLR